MSQEQNHATHLQCLQVKNERDLYDHWMMRIRAIVEDYAALIRARVGAVDVSDRLDGDYVTRATLKELAEEMRDDLERAARVALRRTSGREWISSLLDCAIAEIDWTDVADTYRENIEDVIKEEVAKR